MENKHRIKPIYLSKEIFELISLGSEVSLHSVFNSSLNLTINNKIINVSNNANVLPPYGIVLKDEDFINLKYEIEGNKLILNMNNNEMTVNNIKIDLNNPDKKYSSKIIKTNNKILDSNIQMLKNNVLYLKKKNGFNIENSLLLNFILNKDPLKKYSFNNIKDLDFFSNLNLLENFFLNHKDCEVLKYFIGRGEGLTPSGDDFLVGMMSVFSLYDVFKEELLKIKEFLLKNKGIYTNHISQQFLILATENKFSINIISLLTTLTASEDLDPAAVNHVLDYGETSGVDTVLGMIFAHQIMNRSWINE